MSRIDELGLPIPRKLISTKREFDHVLERRKIQNLDKHLEKSLNTMYCRMVAQKKQTTEKETGKKAVFSNQEWLQSISKPKRLFEPETLERAARKIDNDRILRLAQPRHRPYPEGDINIIPEATLKYVATDRILSLAQPKKEVETEIVYECPRIQYPICPEYAEVKSVGLEKLSRSRHPRQKHQYHTVATDVRCTSFPVSRAAMLYEATVKIRKLAKPKNYDEEELGDVYAVKKKALMKLPKNKEKIFKKMATPTEWKVTPKFEPV